MTAPKYTYRVTPLGFAVTVYRDGDFISEVIEGTIAAAHSCGLARVARGRATSDRIHRMSEPAADKAA